MTEHMHDTAWPLCGLRPKEPPSQAVIDPERLAFIDGIKTQIRNGVYRPDIQDLARSLASMMVRDL